jgi:RHS repeat-associated protein
MKNKYIKILSILMPLMAWVNIYAQITPSTTRSYVIEQTPRKALTTLTNATAYTDVQSTVSYLDGLGRPLQTIIVRGTADGTADIVGSTTVYDNFGRATKGFLPTPNSTAGGAYLANPQTQGETFYNDTHPFTEVTVYDNSPLNRPLTSFGAGQAWRTVGNTKPVNVQYNIPAPNTVIYFQAGLAGIGANTSSFSSEQKAQNLAKGISYEFEGITAADFNNNSPNSPTPTLRYYGANDLTMTTHTSERGKKIIEYRDLQDRVIRKDVEVSADTVLTTHYVYDIFQRLAYVISPEAYKLFSNSKLSISENDTEFKELIYSYRYDSRGRNIRKHIPGAGWTEICYDLLDRPVMSQDQQEASKTPKQWQFIVYDAFSRVIKNGITDQYNSSDRDALQTLFNGITTPYENKDNTKPLLYSTQSFPSSFTITDAEVMKVNYYDDYLNMVPAGLEFLTGTGGDAPFSTFQMNGMLVVSKERNLETNTLYTTAMYYDDRKRMVNQNAENHVGGTDRLNINYSFTGEILKALKTTDKGTAISKITEVSEYLYDHLGRKISYVHNGKPIAKYEYDAIGRLKNKKFSPSGTSQNSKQTGNWTDANSWLSGILPNANDNVTINTGHILTIPSGQIAGAGTLNDKGTLRNFGTLNMGKATSSDLYLQTMSWHIRGGLRGINLDASGNVKNDLFSMKLFYEDDLTYFDGNIRKQEWKTGLDNVTRSFTHRYDGASRIKAGVYSGKTGENYTLADVTYDNNGNIKKLIRNGLISGNTFGIVDNLSYTYNANSNKILKVDDISNVTASFADVAGNDYTYSPDGSLTSDANKGITSIEYNYLKLPKKITFSNSQTVEYQYSASGLKLREKAKDGTIMDYVGNVIYKNNTLFQIGHDEGRILNGEYEYAIKDYLNNVRVLFRDSLGIAKISQSENFGAYGEALKSLNYHRNTTNKSQFVYSAYERSEDLGTYDANARMFDPIVPRFWQIDPLAENDGSFSPYNYTFGNPINFIDPSGMWPTLRMVDGGGGIRSRFGMRKHPLLGVRTGHMGLDLTASVGQGVHVAADGVVKKVSYQFNGSTGWGWYVLVKHKNGYTTRYAHLKSKDDINVKVGDKVTDGQVIAQSGQSGGVTGPHLHFEVMKKGSPIDPENIEDLQVQINVESMDKQIITPVQMTLGGNNNVTPLLNLSRFNIPNNFSTGLPVFVNPQPAQPAAETPKTPKSTSTPVTGATENH